MASFKPKFQISGVKFIKENYNPSILLRSPASIGANVNARSFWFWKKKSVEYGSGNCGLRAPPSVDLVCKGCESKCIEFEEMKRKRKFFTFKKRPEPKKKPDNCEEEEEKPAEEKYTLWETIFGPNPKRFWPDPCTCKLALREKRNRRICDPRLRDSRYELTSGDVFLYTEMIKPYPKGCEEPQPKPPPAYKIPRAALSKMLSSANMTSINRMLINQLNQSKGNANYLEPCRMPYDELRPVEKKRKAFNCLSGVRSKDIVQPMNNDFHSHKVPQQQQQQQQQAAEKPEILKICEQAREKRKASSDSKMKTDSSESGQKLSRIEQLKMQIKQKDMFDYNSCSPAI